MGNAKRLTNAIRRGDYVDTGKWLDRVNQGTVKKNMLAGYNEIQVSNGRVTKMAIRLNY